MTDKRSFVFFLGGHDLEMIEIARMIRTYSQATVFDKSLGWGAKASAYTDEIRETISTGACCALVELEADIDWPIVTNPAEWRVGSLVSVDHHNDRSGEPAALLQVLALLELNRDTLSASERRRIELVSANDVGHIRAMCQLNPPASQDEIDSIRREDRAAQGATETDERAAEAGIRNRQTLFHGRLTIVRSQSPRTSCVTDRMSELLGGPGYQNLLVIADGEPNFFGTSDLIRLLNSTYPDSWSGGNPPGFWGSDSVDADAVFATLRSAMTGTA